VFLKFALRGKFRAAIGAHRQMRHELGIGARQRFFD
jgi:hypothetical protein